MIWPKALVAELASRRCIIFMGAGASAGCISSDSSRSPPTWNFFLESLINAMKDKTDERIIIEYIKKEKFLEAAEIIFKNTSSADFSSFIREEFVTPRYKPSKIHECVLDIDPKIVVTTNYDDIYDSYCRIGTAQEGYNISKYYETHVTSDLRSPRRLILKVHGCISDVSKIILTKSQYFKARQIYSNFYKILDAIFLTHTILFIGYSLSDPDIQLVLENVNIAAPSPHPHYFLIGNNLNAAIMDANRLAYNLEFIEYENNNFIQLNEIMEDLRELVRQHRISNPSI